MSSAPKTELLVKSYHFLTAQERASTSFSKADVSAAVGWAESTVKTYVSKKWEPFVSRVAKDTYRVANLQARFTVDEYVRLMSQADRLSNDPKKPPLQLEVERLVTRARQSALLALDIYNRPATLFRSEGYLVMMVIAWRSLLHAILERDGISYYYRAPDGTTKLIDGEPRTWELSECVRQRWGASNAPVRKNLEFVIALRNKIEHRYVPALDPYVAGECQALLLNFDELLANEFGPYYALREWLAMPLQTSSLRDGPQMEAIRKFQGAQYDELRDFLDEFREALGPTYEDPQYSFRVYLVPRLGNHATSSDLAIEFVRASDLSADDLRELTQRIAFIKDRRVPVANQGRLKPTQVASQVAARIGSPFSVHHHTQAWRMYEVRRSGQDATSCKTDYCQFDEAHGDYVYTAAWVEYLVKRLGASGEYQRLLNYRTSGEA